MLVGGAVTLLLGLSSSIIGDVGLLLLALEADAPFDRGSRRQRRWRRRCEAGHERAGRRRGGGGAAGGSGAVGAASGTVAAGRRRAGSATMPTQLRLTGFTRAAVRCAAHARAPRCAGYPSRRSGSCSCVPWPSRLGLCGDAIVSPVLRTSCRPCFASATAASSPRPSERRAPTLYSSRLATHGGTGGAALAGGRTEFLHQLELPQDDEGETAPTNGDGARETVIMKVASIVLLCMLRSLLEAYVLDGDPPKTLLLLELAPRLS